MSLIQRFKKSSKLNYTSIMSDRPLIAEDEFVDTKIPILNLALSGDVNGGLGSGSMVMAGPSRHFKTGFSLMMAKAYMDKHPDSVLMFYDSEKGAPKQYFEFFDIDLERTLHVPIRNIEELKFDYVSQLESMKPGEKVITVVDSIGNLASKKELNDALTANSAVDMTRAKEIKGFFRMITPYLNILGLPFIGVFHVYANMTGHGVTVSGGTGPYLSANNVWILGRQQVKDDNDVVGYRFVVNIDKSRYVREKSKFLIDISYDEGLSRWSGMLDAAMDVGGIVSPTQGWYQRVDTGTGELVGPKFRRKDASTDEFWAPFMKDSGFVGRLNARYGLPHRKFLENEEIEDDPESGTDGE